MTTPEPSRRVMLAVCAAGVLVGAATILTAMIWPLVVKPEQVWTHEQATEYNAAGSALHAIIGGNDPEALAARAKKSRPHKPTPEEFEAAKERFERSKAELEHARFVKDGLSTLLYRIGLVLMAAFGVGYWAAQR